MSMRFPPVSPKSKHQLEPIDKEETTSSPASLSSNANRTVVYDELATWQKDNPSIIRGYRPECGSWKTCLRSVVQWHNESVNIHSHFLGMIASLVSVLFILFPPSSAAPKSLQRVFGQALITPLYAKPSAEYPSVAWTDAVLFILFFMGAAVCFGCSAVFHTCLCHSERVVRPMNRVDYLGILVFGSVNFYPSFHYGFFCAPFLRDVYITVMTISGSTGIYLICNPAYASPQYRRMRTYTFFFLAVVAVVPFAHVLVMYGWSQGSTSLSLNWIAVEIAAYICGALLYSERCPECLSPGTFDYIGSSHQIFHCCSLLAVWAHYAAIAEGFRYWHGERGGVCL